MSDTETNILDLKKLLVEYKIYEPRMTLPEMKQAFYSFKCKQALEAEGLYEKGMSDQDIKDIYNTLKKSEESADTDKEYREILKRTETNCANIEMIYDDANTTNDETVDVTSVKSVSPNPQSVSKSFSTLPKKSTENQPMIKNINVLMEIGSNHPLLKLRDVRYTNTSLIYYHQKKILKLPLKERAAAISEYLFNLKYKHKNDAISQMKWSHSIQPSLQKKPFNGDLCVDFIPDIPEEVVEEVVDSSKIDETETPVKENSFISTRPKRVVKRKIYLDLMTDDEDDFTAIKKTKSDDFNSSSENSPEAKWIKKKKKAISKTPSYFSQGSERIDKIFNKLKWGDSSNPKAEKKSVPQALQDTMNLSDTDEEVFPTKELVTTANIHDEEQAIKSKNTKATVKAKKPSLKKRAPYNKLSVQKSSATKENESPEIPIVHFYGKNKNSDVDESNNNKLENNEESTNCPICNRPFPVSKIEVHASSCIQYEGQDSETYCDICNENIVDKIYTSHRQECLKKITDASIVVDKPVTRSQRNNGFLCHVCDKYICNTSETQHASNCIAKV